MHIQLFILHLISKANSKAISSFIYHTETTTDVNGVFSLEDAILSEISWVHGIFAFLIILVIIQCINIYITMMQFYWDERIPTFWIIGGNIRQVVDDILEIRTFCLHLNTWFLSQWYDLCLIWFIGLEFLMVVWCKPLTMRTVWWNLAPSLSSTIGRIPSTFRQLPVTPWTGHGSEEGVFH